MARGRQQETFEAAGVIDAVARTGKAFRLDTSADDWYSVFDAKQLNGAQKGDEVEFEYSVANKGGKDFLNVQGDVAVVGQEAPPARPAARAAPARGGGSARAPAARTELRTASESKASASDPRQRSIVRQNSLSQANALLATISRADPERYIEATTVELAEQVVELARVFEAYSMGED